MNVPVVRKDDIVAGLGRLGVAGGDCLMVHSSLKSFGHVEGGADAVIDVLEAALGPEGTLMMPTFSHGACEVFDPKESPSRNGLITETFRKRPGVLRSYHATHAYAARGRRAEEFIRDHDKISTFAPDCPLGKLAYAGGRVLSIGVGFRACTASHIGETEAGAQCFGFRKVPWKARNPETGRIEMMMVDSWRRESCPLGDWGLLEERTRTRTEVGETKVGNCNLMLVSALPVIQAARELRLKGRGAFGGCRECGIKPRSPKQYKE